jgi:hypothetical protein
LLSCQPTLDEHGIRLPYVRRNLPIKWMNHPPLPRRERSGRSPG